jgi:hypothetical protein
MVSSQNGLLLLARRSYTGLIDRGRVDGGSDIKYITCEEELHIALRVLGISVPLYLIDMR